MAGTSGLEGLTFGGSCWDLFSMTMPPSNWATDERLFASLPGGQTVIDWFGFCPVFHDATLDGLELGGGSAVLNIRAFRATSEVNAEGFYVLDRRAVITMRLGNVSGIKLEGDATSIIGALVIRRLPLTPEQTEWATCVGPVAGDIEIAFDTAIGLYGSIYAKELAFELHPVAAPSA